MCKTAEARFKFSTVRLVYTRHGLFGACEFLGFYTCSCTTYSRTSTAILPQWSCVENTQLGTHKLVHKHLSY